MLTKGQECALALVNAAQAGGFSPTDLMRGLLYAIGASIKMDGYNPELAAALRDLATLADTPQKLNNETGQLN